MLKIFLFICLLTTSFNSLANGSFENNSVGKQQNKHSNKTIKVKNKPASKKGNKNWAQKEYSGEHSLKNIRMAVGSKAFSWLSGSPADNEKLSVGKTAQFFGFVALRYQSNRAARRGHLGRSFNNLATKQQRQIIRRAVLAEEQTLKQWWQVRNQLLRQLEQSLYSGEDWDEEKILNTGAQFGYLNAELGRIEMQAFAEIEKLLSPSQWKQLRQWREDPSLAATNKFQKTDIGLNRELNAQYEDLFAKAFSLLTGKFSDREIIPLGQPAQFFGFVSIRHKSGHGASRGKISKQFYGLLTSNQKTYLELASQQLVSPTHKFMTVRTQLLTELDKLRYQSNQTFNLKRYETISRQLGIIEVQCALIEALAYKKVRNSMSNAQVSQLMDIRADYIIDQQSIKITTLEQRGEQLYGLCQGCHNNAQVAPNIRKVFGRKIASVSHYTYSRALLERSEKSWNEQALDEFLHNPKKAVPGTKMEFTGLLNQKDRQALIYYLQQSSQQ